MDIYTLNELQFNALTHSAKNAAPILVPEPNPVGTQEERDEAQNGIKVMQDLVDLGLMINVSGLEKNKASIEQFKERMGYGLQFFLVSPDGYQLFKRENLVVN